MSRKLGFQIAAVLFGLQGFCFVIAADFFGSSLGDDVPIGVAHFIAGSAFLQMSLRSEPGDASGKDEQDQPPE